MLRIRFLRVGKKNRPSFRLVVTQRQNAPKSGRFLEVLGFYDPVKHVKELKKDRIEHWLSVGASASERVHNMLIQEGIVEGKKVAVHKKAAKVKVKEENKKSDVKEPEKESKKDDILRSEKGEEEGGEDAKSEEGAARPEKEPETKKEQPEAGAGDKESSGEKKEKESGEKKKKATPES